MEQPLKILLVEDLDSDAELLVRFLKKENISFTYKRVWLREDYLKILDEYEPELIISDHSLPLFSGMEAFHLLKKTKKNIPFILITGTVSEKLLTSYMKEGLDDYILKENLLRLPSAIQNVVNKKKVEKLHRELTHANEKLKGAYSDIKDSINYASRIQHAILPSDFDLKKISKDYFIFYKPKDIVSGDFYWCATTTTTQTNRHIGILAAVDCTGHGVPGAFMSMLTNTLLNQTVKNPNINSPADVLNFLNTELPKNLKSHEDTVTIRDGMDIALCTIDFENKELSFSGANNSCVIIRTSTLSDKSTIPESSLIELKADKQAISASNDKEKKSFTNQNFTLQKGDTVYLYTDGYIDQFGGINGKKFLRKNLKKLLLSVQQLSLKDQLKFISRTFEEWKGKYEQTDDILVIGVRF
jgi:serine phosphatase RsbU (regulator of sigma subunit)